MNPRLIFIKSDERQQFDKGEQIEHQKKQTKIFEKIVNKICLKNCSFSRSFLQVFSCFINIL